VFIPALGRQAMSAVPKRPVAGDAIFWLPGRTVVAVSDPSLAADEGPFTILKHRGN